MIKPPSCFFRPSYSAALGIGLVGAFCSPIAMAASHREAPLIAQMPKVDGTDFYMFRSYEANRQDFVTMIADYVPLQDAYGGPNYFSMDPKALYEIHINNDGTGKDNLTFQFRFKNTNRNATLSVGGKQVAIPLVINGSTDINTPASAGLNVVETYTVDVVRGDRRHGKRSSITNAATGAVVFNKPVDNIGKKSISDYNSYAAQHVYNVTIPECNVAGGRMFVGQRKDPFVVNLGETFDLINIKLPAVELGANAERAEKDDLADKNITSLVLEVPIACLTNGAEPVIGGWTTASVRQGRLIDSKAGDDVGDDHRGTLEGGPWAQVSRLGNPLVNELVIGLKDKDKFNASRPENDGQFLDYVTNPTLPALIEVLFSSAGVKAPTNFPRNDLIAAFLTGVKGVNQPANVAPAEMLRLNTTTPATAKGTQNRLGVIGGDNAGFPNGRRPGDDVVDIALRVVMGKLCALGIGCVPADAPSGTLQFTDGAFVDDSFSDASFPYVRPPIAGSPNGVSD